VRVFVLNCGSSSLKFQVIETSREQIASSTDIRVARGTIERIGSSGAVGKIATGGGAPRVVTGKFGSHRAAIEAALSWIAEENGDHAIEAIGHRVVHGGERFHESVVVDADVEAGIEACIELAPLHNPANLEGIRACRELFGAETPNVAVFDTAFHQTMPSVAYLYAIPYQFYVGYGVRRYGFHGTSHRYVSYRYRTINEIPREAVRIVTCHLGNGCSMAAIEGGRSIDTSMGFTPLEGLVMGTRSGDVDPGIVLLAITSEGLTAAEVETLLNKQSGLYGLSGLTSDMRTLLEAEAKGDERAKTAVDVFCYRVKQYIGRYQAVLNGADAIVFTGGIGENSPDVRARACANLERIGITIDDARNREAIGREMRISADDSPTAVWAIPTDEELMIARDTVRAIVPE
jgi:acetate kinase